MPPSHIEPLRLSLTSAIEALRSAALENIEQYVPDGLQGLADNVQTAQVGYPLILEERPPHSIDRLGSVLLGPVFTSERHQWPVNATGTPMVPLCQLNTEHFPRQLNGAARGLIQVWLSPRDWSGKETSIRVVPSDDLDVAALSPIIQTDEDLDVLLGDAAEWLACFHAGPRPSKAEWLAAAAIKLGFVDAEALSDGNWDEWVRASDGYDEVHGLDLVSCWQIAGYESQRLYCNITPDMRLEAAKLHKLAQKLRKESRPESMPFVALLENFVTGFNELEQATSESNYPCLFGTFVQIQYEALGCGTPLLCLESVGLKEWGEGGNAQVFYEDGQGFAFDWSCS